MQSESENKLITTAKSGLRGQPLGIIPQTGRRLTEASKYLERFETEYGEGEWERGDGPIQWRDCHYTGYAIVKL